MSDNPDYFTLTKYFKLDEELVRLAYFLVKVVISDNKN